MVVRQVELHWVDWYLGALGAGQPDKLYFRALVASGGGGSAAAADGGGGMATHARLRAHDVTINNSLALTPTSRQPAAGKTVFNNRILFLSLENNNISCDMALNLVTFRVIQRPITNIICIVNKIIHFQP